MDANRELIARYVDQYHRYPLFFFVHHLLFNLFSYLKGVIRHETPRTMDELFAIVIAESEEQGSESLNHATREVQRQFADLVPFFNEVFTNLLEFRPTFRGKVLVLSLMTHQEEEYVNEFEENFQDRHESYRLRVRQKWAIAKLAQIWVDQYRTGKGKRLHKALYGRIPALAYEKTEWGTWKVVDRKAPMVECLTRRMARQGAAMVPVPQQAQEENKPMGDFVFFLEQMEEEAERLREQLEQLRLADIAENRLQRETENVTQENVHGHQQNNPSHRQTYQRNNRGNYQNGNYNNRNNNWNRNHQSNYGNRINNNQRYHNERQQQHRNRWNNGENNYQARNNHWSHQTDRD